MVWFQIEETGNHKVMGKSCKEKTVYGNHDINDENVSLDGVNND